MHHMLDTLHIYFTVTFPIGSTEDKVYSQSHWSSVCSVQLVSGNYCH